MSSHHDLHWHSGHTTESTLNLTPSSMSFITKPTATEVDIKEVVERHVASQEPAWKAVTQRRLDFEHSRPQWLRECLAEATGVFMYVFPGIASAAGFTLNAHHELGVTAFGSVFQIGWAFGVGVAFAVICCAPVSGGHFNPAITLALAFWQDFPWRKVPYYIFSQIVGAFMAGLMLMAVYWTQIQEMNDEFLAAGKPLVAAGAPASILCAFPNDNQTNLAFVFMIEFFVDAFIGVVIWAALDPSNPFVRPASIPFILGLAYANMIWGFGSITLSTNLARDLGTRIVAAIFYGREAFTYMGYAPIGIFVNIPATLLATAYYELVMRNSLKIIGMGQAKHADGEVGLCRHMRKYGVLDEEKGLQILPEEDHGHSGSEKGQ
jgi:MIP family channel proteins